MTSPYTWCNKNTGTSTCTLQNGLLQESYTRCTQLSNTKVPESPNMACRIIIQSKKNEHITQYLIELHWLKIPQCIIFKILTIMYHCFHGTAPIYLQELVIREHSHLRLLHSNGSLRLPTVRSRTSQHFHSSFSSMGPHLWNDIPTFIKISPDIQTFKARLKTHLFWESYEL